MKWECLGSEYLIDSPWLKVRKDKVKLDTGHVMDDYFVIENNDVALIVAVDTDNRVILKKEYRYPIDRELIELPGGTYSRSKEDALSAAKRELLEETGYTSDDWLELGASYDFPTKNTSNVTFFLARNIQRTGEQNLDLSEDISFALYPLEEAVEMALDNRICVNGSVAALLKCKLKYLPQPQ